MSIRQDRLTFFGVLVAVVIAVVGYLQIGTMYPVQGRADVPTLPSIDDVDNQPEQPVGDAQARPEDADP